MPDTAEAHSHSLTTNRNCTIEITNVTANYCLVNPKVHLESGFPFNPPQPTVRTNKSEVCSFIKDDHTASGAVGVLTYELFDMQKRQCKTLMAVMFSVPFDYNFYKNWLAIGLYDCKRACDNGLYKEMYKDEEKSFKRHEADGSGVMYSEHGVDVRATMSNEGKAIIKLEIFDSFQ